MPVSEEREPYPSAAGAPAEQNPAEGWWDAGRVSGLRGTLGDSQQAFADRLGTRQQTVSEWERGASRPGRMARRLLQLIAEQHGVYDTSEGASESVRATGEAERAP